ncbi:flagellar basal body P-ring protein FlgI [Acidocella sp.]|jgi:flagellar P-ring protein precursor FlgI|uniref:flagellar basal body P-ring protein FlgI n=1 Tax=Acidocella sp. TaxID=50710 RepID=UPI002F419DFB
MAATNPFQNLAVLGLAALLLAPAPATADTTEIGTLVSVAGAPSNQLYGYGLVVGLPGTGDQTTEVPFTQQAILNMLRNMGIALPTVTFMQPDDVASVMVTAEVPAFAHAGQHVNVTVSAMGNATSLNGGVLLPTPLRGGNGVIYAQAQGPLLVSGFTVGANGSSTSVNVPTVGSLPGGAIISTTIPASSSENGITQLLLNTPSYQTAQQIADLINAAYGPSTANAVSPGEVDLQDDNSAPVRFIAGVLSLPISPAAQEPTIVVDAQSGTIVMNAGVSLGPAVVSHGDLTVNIQTTNSVSQPNPLTRGGQTVGVQNSVVNAGQGKASIVALPKTATLADVARALNAVGATPSDLIAIIEALKQAGAINGDIKVI